MLFVRTKVAVSWLPTSGDRQLIWIRAGVGLLLFGWWIDGGVWFPDRLHLPFPHAVIVSGHVPLVSSGCCQQWNRLGLTVWQPDLLLFLRRLRITTNLIVGWRRFRPKGVRVPSLLWWFGRGVVVTDCGWAAGVDRSWFLFVLGFRPCLGFIAFI